MRKDFDQTKDVSKISSLLDEDYDDSTQISSHYDLNKTLGIMMNKLEQSKSKIPTISSMRDRSFVDENNSYL